MILGAVATLALTDLLPALYWPGVAMVYIGFGGVIIEGLKGKWHKRWFVNTGIGILGLAGLIWWTGWVVFASIPVVVDAKLGIGNNIQIYIDNGSAYGLDDGDIEIQVDGAVIVNVSQISQVCQGFNYFPESNPVSIGINQGAEHGEILPSSPAWSNKGRIVCAKFPHNSITTLMVSVFTTDLGKDPRNPFPQNAHSTAKPKWCSIKGEYRALGKTRHIDNKITF